jgi:hypothetical protein
MPEQIWVWEKDPASCKFVSAPKPDVKKQPFGFLFPLPEPVPEPGPEPDTSTRSFRYWNAAEALRRGADFWTPAAAPQEHWYHRTPESPLLDVALSNVDDSWNSAYSRNRLYFGRGKQGSGEFIYTAESADLLCHELGHAILDTIRPALWEPLSAETASFHEAFGDLSAFLCALQVESIRTSTLGANGGIIFCNSILSRTAPQFGTALHVFAPKDAEADCLRNTYNPFCYAPFHSLPTDRPASELNAKVHSFSRIFSGALLKILSGMLAMYAQRTSAQLQQVTFDLRDIVVQAVRSAPAVPQYYAAVAAEMVLAAEARNPAYAEIFRDVFVERLILAADSPIEPQMGIANASEEIAAPGNLISLSLPHHGMDQEIVVEAPENPAKSRARSGMVEGQSLVSASAENVARAFLESLLASGLVDLSALDGKSAQTTDGDADMLSTSVTHRLERIGDKLHLTRVRFQCRHCTAGLRSS